MLCSGSVLDEASPDGKQLRRRRGNIAAMIAHRPFAVAAVLGCVVAGATASASPDPHPACRVEWRANASGGHDLEDACLPALSADGKRLLVTRMESGSFSFLVLSVPGKGRVLRRFSAV